MQKTDLHKNDSKNIIDETVNADNSGNSDSKYSFENVFDVGIVGGGFGGLSAALLLGRYLRSTLVFDILKDRNYIVHGYLGFENYPITQAIQKSWSDVLQYNSVRRIEEKVESVEIERDSNFFLIKTSKSSISKGNEDHHVLEKQNNKINEKTFKARYLIIATGVEHLKPRVKNFEKFLGKGIWHCPHCDGFGTLNKKLVIITSNNSSDGGLAYAKLFLGWTRDITVFLQQPNYDGMDNAKDVNYAISNPLTKKQISEAIALDIKIIENDEVIEVVEDVISNTIKGVLTKNSVFYQAEIIFYHLGIDIHNKIACQLGCELDEGFIKVNEKQQTSLPKVYAVGDIDTDRHYAVLATASGTIAAVNIYEELLKESISTTKDKSK